MGYDLLRRESNQVTETPAHDLAHCTLANTQAELRKVQLGIRNDAETANVVGLRDGHLNSEKFMRFGGRTYKCLDFKQRTDGETANLLSVEDYGYEPKDV